MAADITFVILAAGRGTRVGRAGEHVHKALLPLGGRPIISQQIALAPPGAKIVIALGYRGRQIREYIDMAHPGEDIVFVDVDGWDSPQGGPGLSLAACKDEVEGHLRFTSCDTLWSHREEMDDRYAVSWAAIAPIPFGTDGTRWCTMYTAADGELITEIYEKGDQAGPYAYTGLAHIVDEDLETFWRGLNRGRTNGETQVTEGLALVAGLSGLFAMEIHWTDVGDADAYARAVAVESGYDWTKTEEVTYVLPERGRVVKLWANGAIAQKRKQRMEDFNPGVIPRMIAHGDQMVAFEYVPGRTVYETIDNTHLGAVYVTEKVADWATLNLWRPVKTAGETHEAAIRFYRDKLVDRIPALEPRLRRICQDVVRRIDWSRLADGVQPFTFHGDLNYGNIIWSMDRHTLTGIDWRQDFAGHVGWGDRRYDLAKLLGGARVHWGEARRGNFRPWSVARTVEETLLSRLAYTHETKIIAALLLLHSAPLHASPLDEVLVMRGAEWLEELT